MEAFYENEFNKSKKVLDHLVAKKNETENETKWFNQIKDKYTNDNLTDVMKNVGAKRRVIVDGDHLVQKYDPVYQNPSPLMEWYDYRMHFYAPKKPIFGRIYDTFWFNFTVIWMGTIMLYFALYFELFRWIIEKIGNISFSKNK